MRLILVVVALFAAGCDFGPATLGDAAVPDAGAAIDSMLDAPIDAGVSEDAASTHEGTVRVLDTAVVGHPELGHGLQIDIALLPAARAPDVDLLPESPLGCRAWSWDLAAGDRPPVPGDEGTLAITGTSTPVPACTFLPLVGYECVASIGAGVVTILDDSALPPGTLPPDMALVIIEGATFTSADSGRWLTLAGAADAPNNGRFSIVDVPPETDRLVIANPAAVTSEPPFAATWRVSAGLGPVPGIDADPLGDDDLVTVAIAPGGGGHFAWDSGFPFPLMPGEAFSVSDAAQLVMTSGSAMTAGTRVTLDCDGPGGSCAMAAATAVVITTTDAPVAGMPDDYFPPAVGRMVVATCLIGGTGTVELAAPLMSLVAAASPSRIRTTYARVNLAAGISATGVNRTWVHVGHAVTAFATP